MFPSNVLTMRDIGYPEVAVSLDFHFQRVAFIMDFRRRSVRFPRHGVRGSPRPQARKPYKKKNRQARREWDARPAPLHLPVKNKGPGLGEPIPGLTLLLSGNPREGDHNRKYRQKVFLVSRGFLISWSVLYPRLNYIPGFKKCQEAK